VVDEGASIAGYVTLRVKDGSARIGLIAVDHAWRERGYGGRLIQAALRHAASRDAQRMVVATQARNVDAIRVYERHGFRVGGVGLWFHRWF
jgi:dTDP-4-amino-4,6-dideoxy-D-galactose acyltransferase